MPRKIQAIVGTLIAAIAIVALTALPALADTVTVNLGISPATTTYDHDVLITPTIIGTETIPGDAITLETWSSVDATWTLFGEGLKVEDTGTVCPQYVSIDETFLPWYIGGAWTPTNFRATFKPVSRGKDASGTAWPAPPAVVSNTATLTVSKIRTVRVKTSYPKTVKHGKKYTFSAHTQPERRRRHHPLHHHATRLPHRHRQRSRGRQRLGFDQAQVRQERHVQGHRSLARQRLWRRVQGRVHQRQGPLVPIQTAGGRKECFAPSSCACRLAWL